MASSEATSRHLRVDGPVMSLAALTPVPEDAPVVAGAQEGPRHDHPQQHTVEECALGQPPQGPGVDLPCLSPLDPQRQGSVSGPVRVQRGAGRDFVIPIAHAVDSTILRV
ncbi:hypothetical protein AB0H82_07985 [Streptomyces sp. NPDC050732]|uniref:hypothetical protein n=1 Tax=Streptomyces sp. NPDC050732 TaxID=3154632 RepID=UPI00344148BD